jgi:hypothetical protein
LPHSPRHARRRPGIHDLTIDAQLFDEKTWITGFAGRDVERAMGKNLRHLAVNVSQAFPFNLSYGFTFVM